MNKNNIFYNSLIGIIICDNEGKLTNINLTAIKILGFVNSEQAKNVNIFNLFQIKEEYKKKLKTNGVVKFQIEIDFDGINKFEIYASTKLGVGYFDLTITSLESNGFFIKIYDITSQRLKFIKNNFEEVEKNYNFVLENINQVISRHEIDGTCIFISKSCKKLFGYEQKELLLKNVFDFIYKNDAKKLKKHFESSFIDNILVKFLTKNNEYIWIELTGAIVKNEELNKMELILISNDVTKKIKSEKFFKQSEKAINKKNDKTMGEKYPLKILIAEDNQINQFLILNILSYFGYIADFVKDGLEALDAIKSISYNLIFMDIQMPNMNGLEATKFIKKNIENPPKIIAMATSTMKENKELCLSTGMDDYISKPIELDNIYSLLLYWAKLINTNIVRTEEKKINDLVFDKNVLIKIAKTFEEDEKNFIIDTVKKVRTNLESQMKEIINGINDNDLKTVTFLSHKLKGTCLSLGINKLGKFLGKIEIYSKEENITILHSLTNQLELLVIEFIEEFDMFEKN